MNKKLVFILSVSILVYLLHFFFRAFVVPVEEPKGVCWELGTSQMGRGSIWPIGRKIKPAEKGWA